MFRKKALLTGIILLIFFISAYFGYKSIFSEVSEKANILEIFELKTLDMRYYIRGEVKKEFDVVIAGIDEKSLAVYGKWPWKRDLHARLVRNLHDAGVKSIGFDISFVESGVPEYITSYKAKLKERVLDGYKNKKIEAKTAVEIAKTINELDTSEDVVFAEAIRDAGNVTIGTYNLADENSEVLTEEQKNNTTYLKSRHVNLDAGLIEEMFESQRTGKRSFNPNSVYKLLPPIEVLGTFCYGIGPFDIGKPDGDGVFRNLPIATEERYNSTGYFPPLALLVYLKAYNLNMQDNVYYEILKRRVNIYEDASQKSGLKLSIPVDKNGIWHINYYGKRPFKYYSFSDIVEGKIDKSLLKDKIVLVGFTNSAKALYDLRALPFDPNAAGVEIHATAVQNLIDKKFLKPAPLLVNLGVVLLFGLLVVIIMAYKQFDFRAENVGAGIVISIYAVSAIMLFSIGYWVDMFYPMVVLVTMYLVLSSINYFDEEREKIKIKKAFQHYMSPALIEELIKNPEKLKLGGDKKILTCFFSDIEGFTTLSEDMEPEKLVEFLNEYLSEMSDIIFAHDGTVDKYEGDAIMAVFGSPVYMEDHARKCCIAALECQSRLVKLREKWISEGKKPLYVRIGINTGEMVAGNMGSNKKFDFTVIGDEVNLASRLEGANKEYGTFIMISQNTYDAVSDIVEARFLDVIRVKGKNKPVAVYELLAKKGELSEKHKQCVSSYMNGIEMYKKMKWQEAIEEFEKALKIDDKDSPSKLYIERCMRFINEPPEEGWDGVFVFLKK